MKKGFILLSLFTISINASFAACINNNCDEQANRVQKSTQIRVMAELENADELRARCTTDDQNVTLKTDHPKYGDINKKLVAQGMLKGDKYVEVILNENSNACEIAVLQLVE